MTFDPSELREDLADDEFWANETPRFLIFARELILKHRWRGSYGDLPGGGEEPADYVIRAAALIFAGKRRCPPDVDSARFVYGVIRSLITHDAEKPENRRRHSFLSDESQAIDQSQLVDRKSASVDELLAANDLARDFVSTLPEEFRAYVELLISGECDTAAECAERLGVEVADIRSMDKAIRRRRRAWKGRPPR